MTFIRLFFELVVLLLITKLFFNYLIDISFKYNWIDKPDNFRKIHKKIIPNTAGVIFVPFILISMLSIIKFFGASNVQILAVGFSYLFFVLMGWIDDRNILNFRIRLILQISIIIINLPITGWDMSQFLKIFYLQNILPEPFTFLFVSLFLVGAMNAINWWDGVNGNFGFWILNFSVVLFFILPIELLDAWNFLFVTSILFIIYNYPNAKIFMGDVGTMPIGFIFSYLTLQVLQYKNFDSIIKYNFNPYLIITLVWALPFFDMIRLIIVRWLNKVSPALADNSHLHHYIYNLFTNKGVLIVIFIYIAMNLISFLIIKNIWIGLGLYLLFYIVVLAIILMMPKKILPRS